MTKPLEPYSRVYWAIRDDEKFAGVYCNDRLLATWLRLLIAADMAWPASAVLYLGVSMPAVRTLAGVGLIDLGDGGRFRIHGLDKERQRRSDYGRSAIAQRWNRPSGPDTTEDDDGMAGSPARMPPYPPSNTDGITQRIPSRDEPKRDEQSRAETRRGNGIPDPLGLGVVPFRGGR